PSLVTAAQVRLRAKLSYTNIGFAIAPATFTISELREIYVAALGHDVSATNLQRVLVRRGVLERVGQPRPRAQRAAAPPPSPASGGTGWRSRANSRRFALPRQAGRGDKTMSADDDGRAHPPRSVVCEGAPEAVAARAKGHRQLGPAARLDDRGAGDVARADVLAAQVVRVLAEVRELDRHGPRTELRARQLERELARNHLHPRRRRRAAQRDGAERERGHRSHFTSCGRANFDACGMTRDASKCSHCSSRAA